MGGRRPFEKYSVVNGQVYYSTGAVGHDETEKANKLDDETKTEETKTDETKIHNLVVEFGLYYECDIPFL